jgi:hypothetical protein
VNVCFEVMAYCLHALLSLTMLATLTQLEPLVYTKPEDEYFHKHCSWSFTIATPKVLLKYVPPLVAHSLGTCVITLPTDHTHCSSACRRGSLQRI